MYIHFYINVKYFISLPDRNTTALQNGMEKTYNLDESSTKVSESPSKQIFGYDSLLLSNIFRWTIAELANSHFVVSKHTAANL